MRSIARISAPELRRSDLDLVSGGAPGDDDATHSGAVRHARRDGEFRHRAPRPGLLRESDRGGFRPGGRGGPLEAWPAAGKRKRRERRNGEFHGLCPHSASIFPQSRSAGNRDYILNGSSIKTARHAGGGFARSVSTYVN